MFIYFVIYLESKLPKIPIIILVNRQRGDRPSGQK